jgi:selenocysteine lyase/cysteine desulfurase
MVEHETAAPGYNDDDESPRSQCSASRSSSRVVYLNNAGQARLSDAAKRAGIHALTSPILPYADVDLRKIRNLFATVIGATEADVCIHPSTAFSITMAAENIFRRHVENGSGATRRVGDVEATTTTQPGRIIVLEDQMCSAVYGWQDIVQRSKGTLKLDIVPFPSPDACASWTDLILERLEGNVVACCLPPLHWSDGSLIDLVRVGDVCRAKSVPLIVDSTQATGIMECDVKRIQPTLMACSVHKWLRSCSGASLVYVHPSVRDEWQPLDQHGRGRDFGTPAYDASKDEMSDDGYPTTFFKDARKFDSGGKPNPVLLPILRASLEEIVTLDIEEAQQQLRALMSPFLEWATRHGYTFPTSHAHHLVGIRPTSQASTEKMIAIAERLESAHNVCIAVRCGAFRISPYLDCTPSDMDRLVQALEQEALHL